MEEELKALGKKKSNMGISGLTVELSQLCTVPSRALPWKKRMSISAKVTPKRYGNTRSACARRSLFLCDLLPYIKGSICMNQNTKKKRVLPSSLHSSLPSLFQK